MSDLASTLTDLADTPLPHGDDLESNSEAEAAKAAIDRRRLQVEHLSSRMTAADGLSNGEVAALTVVAAVDAATQAWRGWAGSMRRLAGRATEASSSPAEAQSPRAAEREARKEAQKRAASIDAAEASELHQRAIYSERRELELRTQLNTERATRDAAVAARLRALRDRLADAGGESRYNSSQQQHGLLLSASQKPPLAPVPFPRRSFVGHASSPLRASAILRNSSSAAASAAAHHPPSLLSSPRTPQPGLHGTPTRSPPNAAAASSPGLDHAATTADGAASELAAALEEVEAEAEGLCTTGRLGELSRELQRERGGGGGDAP